MQRLPKEEEKGKENESENAGDGSLEGMSWDKRQRLSLGGGVGAQSKNARSFINE